MHKLQRLNAYKKIRKAKTDPEALPSEAKGLEDRPEARNLVNIYAGLSGLTVDQVLTDVGGKQFSEFKPMLSELAVEKLSPISTEMARLMEHQDEIDKILAHGAGLLSLRCLGNHVVAHARC